jgi:N,N'-diacetyllegionaminate synthase
MQCTTEYPAPIEEANLLAMVDMGNRWGVATGFSDHTAGHEASVAAVALGASVIEKHITLDRQMEGPDHAASLEPQEFATMVASVRRVQQSLGGVEKVVTSAEAPNRQVIRKSIVATRVIEEGEIFSAENLGVMRPATGISPMEWPQILGAKAQRSYLPQEMIESP